MMLSLLFLACAENQGERFEVSATPAPAVPSVVTIEWTTDTPGRGYVSFGVPGEETYQTPVEADESTFHRRVLLGMPVDTEVEFQAFGEDGTESAVSTVTTGSAPAGLPMLSTTSGNASWNGWIFAGLAGSSGGIVAYDNQSRLVWWWQPENTATIVLKAEPSLDGEGVYANVTELDLSGASSMVRVGWTGEVEAADSVSGFTHDFVEVEPGLIGGIVKRDHTTASGQPCTAEAIMEFELGESPELVWDAWDEYADDKVECPPENVDTTWSHVNAIDYDRTTDSYLVGSRNLSTITAVDRPSANVNFSIGDWGHFKFDQATLPMRMQHQFQHLPNGNILVFDDGNPDRPYSRLVEFKMDAGSGMAQLVWSYEANRERYVYALGDVDRLDNGNTLAVWSTLGLIEEVSPAGEPVWSLQSDLGSALGYMRRVTDLYGEAAE